jgi:hypothetical protein
MALSLGSALSVLGTLFYWQEDASFFSGSYTSVLFDSTVQVAHPFGKIGTAVGYFFLYRGFGVVVLGWLYAVFSFGARLAFLIRFRPLRFLAHLLVWSALLPWALGMSLPVLWGPYAGSLGWFLADWSRQWTGIAGAWMIWAVGAGLYAVVVFKITPQQLASTLPKRAAAESETPLDSLPPSDFTNEQPYVVDVAAPAVDWSAEPNQPLPTVEQDALSPPWDEADDDALVPVLLVPREPVVEFNADGLDSSPIALELEPTPVAPPVEKVVVSDETDYGSIGSAFDPRRDLSGYRWIYSMPTEAKTLWWTPKSWRPTRTALWRP